MMTGPAFLTAPEFHLRHRLPLPSLFVLALLLCGRLPTGQAAETVPLAGAGELVGAVFTLADQRLAVMPDVAAAKWASGQPITDASREAIVIRAAGDGATALGLGRTPVEALFELQVRLARETQEALHARWRRDGYHEPGPVPSLANVLRPQLDRLTRELMQALYLAAPSSAGQDLAAIAAERLPRQRWSDSARAEFVAALAQVRLEGARTPARARAAGLLRIGTPGDYAPFATLHDDRLEGSDVDLAVRLAATLGLRPVFIASRWGTLVDDLQADRFDLAIGGISITEARRTRASFSLPLARGGKTAIGRCRDRDRLATWAAIDHDGVRIIENAGGTNEGFARRQLRHAALLIHPDNRTVFAELSADRADVMFTDDTEIALVTHQRPELCRLLSELYDPAEKAILLPHDGGWTEEVDGWLRQALAQGLPAALLAEHLAR